MPDREGKQSVGLVDEALPRLGGGIGQEMANGSHARNRSLFLATSTSGLAKVTSVILNALAVPIAVRSLGIDGYGLWMTISSISSFLVFSDLGLSNGLVAVVSEANGKGDQRSAINAVSTTFFALLSIALILIIVILAGGPLLPWAKMLNLTKSSVAAELNGAIIWFLCLQVAIVPALVAQKIQIGYQEMHWTNSWQVLGSLLSFGGVLLASKMGLGLTFFVVMFGVGPLVAQLAANLALFGKLRPWLRPRLSRFHWTCARDLARTGGSFALLQVLAVLGNSTDQIILTRYLGLFAVAEYSLAQRLFSGGSVIQFFLVPLWPAFGEALARGDSAWARLALKRTLIISLLLSTGGAAVIALAAPAISSRWVPEMRQAPIGLLAAFVAQSLISAYGGTMSAFLNNRRTLQPQLVLYAVASIGAFVAKIFLVKTIGISGVLWGTFGGYALFYVLPAWNLAQNTLGQIEPQSGGAISSDSD